MQEARVSVGALSPHPLRALAAEKALAGGKLSAGVIDAAALELGRDLDAVRASDFKKAVAASLFGKFLNDVCLKVKK